jgi:hypothetical protein
VVNGLTRLLGFHTSAAVRTIVSLSEPIVTMTPATDTPTCTAVAPGVDFKMNFAVPRFYSAPGAKMIANARFLNAFSRERWARRRLPRAQIWERFLDLITD